MKKVFIILSLEFLSGTTVYAQDNVAEIAHSFIKALKANDIKLIQNRFLDVNTAYTILSKESAGMNAKQKNETYIKPLYKKFVETFKKIQDQIKDKNIDTRRIDLVSYKIEKMKENDKTIPVAMSLFFNYNKKEHLIPISVIEIDEHWYIIEILNTSNLFK